MAALYDANQFSSTAGSMVIGGAPAENDMEIDSPPIHTTIFIDCSGSTGGRDSYWDGVAKIIESNGPAATVVFWDDHATQLDYDGAIAWAKRREGRGGTSPSCFCHLALENSRIVIVTDGQVFGGDVTQCDSILQMREFASVEVHFFNTGGTINLSVSAPFTRCTEYTVYKDSELVGQGSTRNPIVLDKYEGEPELFLAEADDLLHQITIANMGFANQALRDRLLTLQKNLLAFIAKRISKASGIENVCNKLRGFFDGGESAAVVDDVAVAGGGSLPSSLRDCYDLLRPIVHMAGDSLGPQIESTIKLMIEKCSGEGDFSFDNLQPGRLRRAKDVREVKADDAQPETHYKGVFECPITLDSALPTLLLVVGGPVVDFSEVGEDEPAKKRYLNDIVSNPFLLLSNKDLVNKIKNRLDHVFGLEGTQALFAEGRQDGDDDDDMMNYDGDGRVRSPTTRRRVSAAFVLGTDPTHCDATDFALANLLFGRKLIGQAEIWLGVLYLVMRQVPYLANNEAFMNAFRDHLVHRTRTRKTYMTLSGLPIAPMVKCPVDIALWYCVVSPHVLLTEDSPTDDERNRLRMLSNGAPFAVELLGVLGLPFDRAWTLRRMALNHAFTCMMISEKEGTNWRTVLRAQYQNSLKLSNGSVVLLDGPVQDPSKIPPLPDFSVTVDQETYRPTLGELVALARLVDRQKKNEAVKIPLDFVGAVEGDPDFRVVVNYSYDPTSQPVRFNVPICPATMRPYTVDRACNQDWHNSAEQAHGPLKDQLSVYSYFIKFVTDLKRYPRCEDEFIKYMAVKQANREGGRAKDTLPAAIGIVAEGVILSYEQVCGRQFNRLPAEEFIKIAKASVSREERLRREAAESS